MSKSRLGRNPFAPKTRVEKKSSSPRVTKPSKKSSARVRRTREPQFEETGFFEKVTVQVITLTLFAYMIAKTAFERTTGQST